MSCARHAAVWVAGWLAVMGSDGAHARDEIPPPVGDVVRPHSGDRGPSRPTSSAAERDRAATDGPMCGGELALDKTEPPTHLGVLLQEPATEGERDTVERAMQACASLRGPVRRVADPFLVLALVRLEAELGAPMGLFAATYCVEVSMRAEGRHDGRHLGDWWNGRPLAAGPLQLHEGVWLGVCGGTPDAPHDLLWAAGCYWQNVQRVLEVRGFEHCRARDRLRAAEAAASNVRKYGLRCDSVSAHWRVMEAAR